MNINFEKISESLVRLGLSKAADSFIQVGIDEYYKKFLKDKDFIFPIESSLEEQKEWVEKKIGNKKWFDIAYNPNILKEVNGLYCNFRDMDKMLYDKLCCCLNRYLFYVKKAYTFKKQKIYNEQYINCRNKLENYYFKTFEYLDKFDIVVTMQSSKKIQNISEKNKHFIHYRMIMVKLKKILEEKHEHILYFIN